MSITDSIIGQKIRSMRKRMGYNQANLAKLLGKSLRTVQKYESGEIQVSVSMINELAKILNTTSTYLLGYDTDNKPLECLSDFMRFLFELEKVKDMEFRINVKRPPRDTAWECSLTFGGKSAEHNADICLFLEDWNSMREDLADGSISKERYDKWKDQTLAYYSSVTLGQQNE